MLLADIDPIQIAIIVIAMVIGFLQWLWKVIQQSAAAKSANTPVDPEEKRRRDEAWRRQVQQQQMPPPRPSPTATPPPLNDPWGSVREIFDKMKEEMRKAQKESSGHPSRPAVPSRPSLPPQLPLPQRPPSTSSRDEWRNQPRPQSQSLRPATLPGPVPALRAAHLPAPHAVHAPVVARQGTARSLASNPRPDHLGLRGMLTNPASLKQAILLREVLGPPKSLQSFADSPI